MRERNLLVRFYAAIVQFRLKCRRQSNRVRRDLGHVSRQRQIGNGARDRLRESIARDSRLRTLMRGEAGSGRRGRRFDLVVLLLVVVEKGVRMRMVIADAADR